MSEWQPIETAPKDGTSILVAGGTWDRNDGYYGDLQFPGVEIVRWHASYHHWRGSDVDAHDEWMVHKPTRWMPLPDPP